ncbi:DUF6123 family protein [Bacillus sp. 1NLA3E]|uniref:DUF6123 family protein n=1 Tax=Bacillus sp. 1NLA3E TaxID=666686 RepID=UPI000247F3CD|nr:DUF6123 family protein [Bacillus sp. 1NLA3E]AGK54635.1 hypothetical protein B1NLA3E_14445 [Bacillus sp. 1NLA3E]
MQTIEEYLHFLQGKGFQFQEDAIGFIYFGKHYTSATDEQVISAIELTLKAQKQFEGSFYVSLLEMLTANQVQTRKDAIQFVKKNELLAI